MNRAWRQRVDTVFEESLDLPPERRAGYLARRCAGEADLRAAVDELLRLTEDRAPVLDEPCDPALLLGGDGGSQPSDAPVPGAVIGPWRVVRLLGSGGMGAVFLVERCDGQFQQTAALKLTRVGLDPALITRRFERERQIVASLNHPGIARLLDGGRTSDGRPYFVMEYVEGRAIDEECDARRLSIGERLLLFEGVCRAVQHAHSRLVVHRDVKPSNIIVTADGDVKLLDFGIAGILAPSGRETGESADALSRIVTPDYASPEQIRGEPVATSSDIYQLGLLLYELLTGARAQHVPGATPAEVAHAVCHSLPPPPSERIATADAAACLARGASRAKLTRTLRGDLDAIAACALRKEPQRRYAAVADFLDDIRRYANGEPVQARAGRLPYRARKFVLRHRLAVASAGAILATVIVVAPIATSDRIRAAREQQRARQVEDVLGHLFRMPGAPSLARAPSASDLVEHATLLVRRDLVGQPRSQARLLTMLGEVYTALGRYDTATAVLEEAQEHRERLFGPGSEDVAHTLLRLGQSHHYAGRYAEAERTIRRAGAIRQDRLGAGHLETLTASLELGDLLHSRGDLLAADGVLRGAIEGLRAAAPAPAVRARALRDHANVLRDRGELAASEARFREALSMLEESEADTALQAAVTDVYFARLLVRQGVFAEADERLARSLHALRLLYDGDHPTTAFALQNIGYLRTAQRRYRDAAARFDDAYRVAVTWLGLEHPLVARIDADRADLAGREGRLGDSLATGARALALFERLGLRHHPAAVDTRIGMGEALLQAGRTPEAAVHLREGTALAQELYAPGDPRIARARQLLARVVGP